MKATVTEAGKARRIPVKPSTAGIAFTRYSSCTILVHSHPRLLFYLSIILPIIIVSFQAKVVL
jgi:hypothetical protein